MSFTSFKERLQRISRKPEFDPAGKPYFLKFMVRLHRGTHKLLFGIN